MNTLLNNPHLVVYILAALAIATPLVALMGRRKRPDLFQVRLSVVIAAAGPIALGLWFVHNLVLETVGFDSILSVAIMFTLAGGLGLGAGIWAARETRPRR